MNLVNMIKLAMSGGKNPQEIAMNMIGNNANPVMQNLINMAKSGDTQGVENFARNMFKEQGRDFDSEINEFMKNFK